MSELRNEEISSGELFNKCLMVFLGNGNTVEDVL